MYLIELLDTDNPQLTYSEEGNAPVLQIKAADGRTATLTLSGFLPGGQDFLPHIRKEKGKILHNAKPWEISFQAPLTRIPIREVMLPLDWNAKNHG